MKTIKASYLAIPDKDRKTIEKIVESHDQFAISRGFVLHEKRGVSKSKDDYDEEYDSSCEAIFDFGGSSSPFLTGKIHIVIKSLTGRGLGKLS